MSKEMLVIALGLWVIVIPKLGIPGSWREILLILTGACIVFVGFLLRGEVISRRVQNSEKNTLVEKKSSEERGA